MVAVLVQGLLYWYEGSLTGMRVVVLVRGLVLVKKQSYLHTGSCIGTKNVILR